jgi:hypothetical protein
LKQPLKDAIQRRQQHLERYNSIKRPLKQNAIFGDLWTYKYSKKNKYPKPGSKSNAHLNSRASNPIKSAIQETSFNAYARHASS